MAKSANQLRTFRVLAKVEVESWHDIKAATFEQAGQIADSLKASDFVESVGELYECGPVQVTSVSLEV